MVQDNLWSRYAPEPAGADDLRYEQRQQEEALQEKARMKVGVYICVWYIDISASKPMIGYR